MQCHCWMWFWIRDKVLQSILGSQVLGRKWGTSACSTQIPNWSYPPPSAVSKPASEELCGKFWVWLTQTECLKKTTGCCISINYVGPWKGPEPHLSDQLGYSCHALLSSSIPLSNPLFFASISCSSTLILSNKPLTSPTLPFASITFPTHHLLFLSSISSSNPLLLSNISCQLPLSFSASSFQNPSFLPASPFQPTSSIQPVFSSSDLSVFSRLHHLNPWFVTSILFSTTSLFMQSSKYHCSFQHQSFKPSTSISIFPPPSLFPASLTSVTLIQTTIVV